MQIRSLLHDFTRLHSKQDASSDLSAHSDRIQFEWVYSTSICTMSAMQVQVRSSLRNDSEKLINQAKKHLSLFTDFLNKICFFKLSSVLTWDCLFFCRSFWVTMRVRCAVISENLIAKNSLFCLLVVYFSWFTLSYS